MEPRYYQQAAATQAWRYLHAHTGNPCIVLPTGAGKSLTMSMMIRDAVAEGKRVILVTHAKELLFQIADTLAKIGVFDVGIYSAGINRRDTDNQVILAGIQSVYSRAEIFGFRHYCFIDEAHRINPKSSDTMYGQFFESMPNTRLIGFTATPYRLGSGSIVDKDSWLNEIVYSISVRELVVNGYLCRLTSKWMDGISTDGLAIRNKEFAEEAQQALFLEISDQICLDVFNRTQDRNSILFFCSGVAAVQKVSDWFQYRGIPCGSITGDTSSELRDRYIEEFRNGSIRYLANCNVLTEGFDAPNIDAIVLARATLSPGLYYQMAGRGLRKHESKENCLILDYGENIARHGPIDRVSPNVSGMKGGGGGKAPVKKCPNCFEVVSISAKSCDTCSHEFESEIDATKKLKDKPSKEAAMSDEEEGQWYAVGSMSLSVHTKKNSPESPKTMAVSYFAGMPIGHPIARQFICLEHSGFARNKAVKWWKGFISTEAPSSADAGVFVLTKAIQKKQATPPLAIFCKRSNYDPRFLDVVKLSWSKKDVPVLVDESEYEDEF